MNLIKLKAFFLQFPFITPKRIIYSCEEWITDSFKSKGNYMGQRGSWFKHIYPSNFLHLNPPKTLGIKNPLPFKNNQNYFTAKSNLYQLQNCFLLGHMGLILTKKNEVFQEFTHNFNISSLKKFFLKNPFYAFSKTFENAGFTGAVLISPQSHNYYHWLSDVLPRIKLYENVFNEIDFFCISSNVPEKFLEILPTFGIPKEKLYRVKEREKLFFNYLYVASLPGSEGRAPVWAIEYIKEKFVSFGTNIPSEKIYLRRGDKNPRQILNEAEIIEALKHRGFKIINPDELSVFDQISLMKQAKVVISAHGAALANLLYVNENTAVIEIFSPQYFRMDCFYTLSAIKNLNYYYIVGEKVDGKPWGDVKVSIEILEKTLNEVF